MPTDSTVRAGTYRSYSRSRILHIKRISKHNPDIDTLPLYKYKTQDNMRTDQKHKSESQFPHKTARNPFSLSAFFFLIRKTMPNRICILDNSKSHTLPCQIFVSYVIQQRTS